MNTQENKPTEQNEQSKENVWTDGSLDEIEYIKFEDAKNRTVKVKFLENDPTSRKNKFDQACFDFQVMDLDTKTLKVFSVTSKRLMRELKTCLPLDGKDLCIQRMGSEMETDYNVTEINPKA